jgi:hypothetical protein
VVLPQWDVKDRTSSLRIQPFVAVLLNHDDSVLNLNQPYCKSETHGDEEIGLGLVEIDPDDLTDSVCGIDQRPHVLLAFAKLDDSLPRYQYSRIGRECVNDDYDLGSLPPLGKSYITVGRLNFLESCLKSPENLVKGIRRNDIDRLQCKMRVDTRDKTCRFVDGVVGDAC